MRVADEHFPMLRLFERNGASHRPPATGHWPLAQHALSGRRLVPKSLRQILICRMPSILRCPVLRKLPMPKIKPFCAIHPRPELAAQVASVPYDVVNRAEAAELARGNAMSFLHVIRPDIDLPSETDPYDDVIYETAAANLQRLIAGGQLVRDAAPSIFLYRQVMGQQSQVGLVCCCHVDDYENNHILKHEKTRKAKEDDRTRHVIELNAHAGPVFLTYRDQPEIDAIVEQQLKQEPLFDFTAPDGVQHTGWRIEDAMEMGELRDRFGRVPNFYVADGHHRAASAWRAAQHHRQLNPDATGDEEFNWFLTVLFPASQLNILAYNRVVKDLHGKSPEEFLAAIGEQHQVSASSQAVPAGPGSFGVYLDGSWYQVTVPEDEIPAGDPVQSLDVALLERRVLTPLLGITDVRTDSRIDFVGGIRGTDELERLVDSGAWACAFSMYPTSIDQLLAVSDAGETMPPKSTWFEPKLRSGLFIHELG